MQKRYWLRGGIIGTITTLLIVLYVGYFPSYTCMKVPLGEPTNCSRVLDVTPGFILELLTVGIIICGGTGWLYGKIKDRFIHKS